MTETGETVRSMIPADVPPRMVQAWVDCLLWAIGEEGIREAFRVDSGLAYVAPRNGIERMIDEATGADRGFILAFVPWFNANIWGPMDGEVDDDAE